jgi:hypothetical protein
MRKILLLSLLISTATFAHESAKGRQQEPDGIAAVEQTADGKVYGQRLPATMPVAVDIDTAAADPQAHAGRLAAFSGRITEVCQQSGCWIVLAGENGQLARVSMHDHSFGVPKNSAGAAVVYGTLGEARLGAREIEHLKRDGAAEPKARELQIDAVSVLIKTAS